MIFAEALTDADQFRRFAEAVPVPGAGQHDGIRPQPAV